jgi:pimeloyl-ACP methyl ester carboxylesterase
MGCALHYLERGAGPTVVLLHRKGVFANDFELSGLLDKAAELHPVIAFDRPGFGYSERPSGTSWTPEAQARLIYQALHELRVERPMVNHSWGARWWRWQWRPTPKYVRGIAHIGDYFYPRARTDAALAAMPALPVLSHFWRYTVAPMMGRMRWPQLIERMFRPSRRSDSGACRSDPAPQTRRHAWCKINKKAIFLYDEAHE